MNSFVLLVSMSLMTIAIAGAQDAPISPAPPAPTQIDPVPPKGKVILQREEKEPLPDEDAPDTESKPADAAAASEPSSLYAGTQTPNVTDASVSVSDEEREAITFTAYDLDLHLTPATAGIEAHANFTVRNDGRSPLMQIALQLSSSLVWEDNQKFNTMHNFGCVYMSGDTIYKECSIHPSFHLKCSSKTKGMESVMPASLFCIPTVGSRTRLSHSIVTSVKGWPIVTKECGSAIILSLNLSGYRKAGSM